MYAESRLATHVKPRKYPPYQKNYIRDAALPAPWESPDYDPDADLMASLPPIRDWHERRAYMVSHLRYTLAIARHSVVRKCAIPGRPALKGDVLKRYVKRLRLALALWERELAEGAPMRDAPSSDEFTAGFWSGAR